MIKQLTNNLVLATVAVIALVFYAPSILQPKLTAYGATSKHRITQTHCWGYDEEWECETGERYIPS